MPSATSSSTRLKGRSKSSTKHPRHVRIGHVLARLALVASSFSFITALLTANMSVNALNAPILNALNKASVPGWGAGAQTSIGRIAGSIILAVLGLLGVVFVVLLTYGGFLWLSAAGEEEKVKKAQGLIVNSIIGILIVIAAYTIAWYVLGKLSGAV